MSNAREKFKGNLKASTEFCNEVVIYDLPGNTFNVASDKQPSCTGLRREQQSTLKAVSGDCL